jgi:predicted transcriptional regulator
MDPALFEQLNLLVAATDRDRPYHLRQALANYIEQQIWQIGSIQEGLDDAKVGNFIELTDIERKWGLE